MQIELGAMARPLTEQFASMELTPEQMTELEKLERDAHAITRLYLRDLMPESQMMKSRRKLVKKIERALSA